MSSTRRKLQHFVYTLTSCWSPRHFRGEEGSRYKKAVNFLHPCQTDDEVYVVEYSDGKYFTGRWRFLNRLFSSEFWGANSGVKFFAWQNEILTRQVRAIRVRTYHGAWTLAPRKKSVRGFPLKCWFNIPVCWMNWTFPINCGRAATQVGVLKQHLD